MRWPIKMSVETEYLDANEEGSPEEPLPCSAHWGLVEVGE
jgi:hypothetical protein